MQKTKFIVLSLLTILFCANCSSNNSKDIKIDGHKLFPQGPMVVRTTAYSHNERDHRKYGRKNAVGTQLKGGTIRSAAADWSEFPVGTVFKIKQFPKYTFVIDDYGSALVGTRTIDLYQTSMAGIKRWGVRHVEIEILKWGSYERSWDILRGRTKFAHVKRMNDNIIAKIN